MKAVDELIDTFKEYLKEHARGEISESSIKAYARIFRKVVSYMDDKGYNPEYVVNRPDEFIEEMLAFREGTSASWKRSFVSVLRTYIIPFFSSIISDKQLAEKVAEKHSEAEEVPVVEAKEVEEEERLSMFSNPVIVCYRIGPRERIDFFVAIRAWREEDFFVFEGASLESYASYKRKKSRGARMYTSSWEEYGGVELITRSIPVDKIFYVDIVGEPIQKFRIKAYLESLYNSIYVRDENF